VFSLFSLPFPPIRRTPRGPSDAGLRRMFSLFPLSRHAGRKEEEERPAEAAHAARTAHVAQTGGNGGNGVGVGVANSRRTGLGDRYWRSFWWGER
jgi:hypothetical protein